MSKASIWI